jgi:hypothetical protein
MPLFVIRLAEPGQGADARQIREERLRDPLGVGQFLAPSDEGPDLPEFTDYDPPTFR